jgi:hypothetical protein
VELYTLSSIRLHVVVLSAQRHLYFYHLFVRKTYLLRFMKVKYKCIHFLKWMTEYRTHRFVQRLRLTFSNGPSRVGVSHPHLRTETDTVSETLCLLIYLTTYEVPSVLHRRQNPLGSANSAKYLNSKERISIVRTALLP